jgi:hypothetical protein
LVKRRPTCDDRRAVLHLVNLLAVTFLFYAAVTRGGLAVARVLDRLTAR